MANDKLCTWTLPAPSKLAAALDLPSWRAYGPDIRLKPRPGLTYHVAHGLSAVLAAFDEHAICVGWIEALDLGFKNAGAFMDAYGYAWKHEIQWSPYA